MHSSQTIQADHLTRTFGPTRALQDVSIRFNGGEVHGLVGENGAGKSTLMNLLSGVLRPTSGRILIDDQPQIFPDVAAAERAGVVMIHQELSLIDELSVADNLTLGRERTRVGLIVRQLELAGQIMRRLKTPIDVKRKVRELSLAQRQMVEIGKAIARSARVLILDEPTAVLSRNETAALFDVIRSLRSDGVAIIYISHLLPEVLQLSDRITVLRDGQVAASIDSVAEKSVTEKQLATMMVGRPLGAHYPPRGRGNQDMLLEVRSLHLPGIVHDVSFHIRAGEILGFAGLIGAGRTEAAEAIAGLRRRRSGDIVLARETIDVRTPRDAVDAGIAYLSEDRKGSGLTMDLSIERNITLASLRRYSRGVLRVKAEREAATDYIDRLRIKKTNPAAAASTLSGGNQQKVLLAKWLDVEPRLLIVDEPTRGVDIGAREEIYRLLRELVSGGLACMLISSDLNEVRGMSDRIAVMRAGRIVATLNAQDATEQQLIELVTGAADQSAPALAITKSADGSAA